MAKIDFNDPEKRAELLKKLQQTPDKELKESLSVLLENLSEKLHLETDSYPEFDAILRAETILDSLSEFIKIQQERTNTVLHYLHKNGEKITGLLYKHYLLMPYYLYTWENEFKEKEGFMLCADKAHKKNRKTIQEIKENTAEKPCLYEKIVGNNFTPKNEIPNHLVPHLDFYLAEGFYVITEKLDEIGFKVDFKETLSSLFLYNGLTHKIQDLFSDKKINHKDACITILGYIKEKSNEQ